MIKKYFGILLLFFTLSGVAHTNVKITALNLPEVLTAAQQLPTTGVIKAYHRTQYGHEGAEGSVLLYLSVSDQYIHKLFPLLKQALQQQYPDMQPSRNTLGAHISLYRDAPADVLHTINQRYSFKVTNIKLIRITRSYDDSDQVFQTYFIGFDVDAPQLERTLQQIDPSWELKHLHLSVAEWHPDSTGSLEGQ